MKTFRIVLIAFTLVLTGLWQPAAADDNAKHNDIVRLLKITGSLQMADQMATAMFQQTVQQLKNKKPDIPERAIKAMEEESIGFMREIMPGLINKIVPVYAQYFSHDEIKQMISFYETPVGRKAVSVMPQMVQQVMTMSQQYVMGLAPQLMQRIMDRLEAEGYLKKT